MFKKFVSIIPLMLVLSILTRTNYASKFDSSVRFLPLTSVPGGLVAWGDYDQDGDPDLVTGCTFHDRYAHVIKNDPTGTFTEIATLPCGHNIHGQSQPWGDYDQDNYLDLALPGRDVSYLYHYSKDTGKFEEDSNPFPIQSSGGAWFQWGDIDGINGPDLVLVGVNHSGLYLNDGDGTLYYSQNLPHRDNHSGDLGDYDNDGDLDLVLTGKTPGGPGPWHFEIFNNESGVLSLETTLQGIAGTGTHWIDYDSDGLLDIFVIGHDNHIDYHVDLWHQSPIRTFTHDDSQPYLDAFELFNLNVRNYGIAAWGDYNNDNNPDLIISCTLMEGGCRTRAFLNDDSGTLKRDFGSGLSNRVCYFYPRFSDIDLDGDLDLAAWLEVDGTIIFNNDLLLEHAYYIPFYQN
jgi:hypothetical protein